MNKYLRLFRFGNGLMGIIGLIISIFIATGYDMADHVWQIILGCVVVLAFVAGGNSLNDSIDANIDKTAHPERPIPMGEITVETAKKCGIGGLLVAIIASIPLGLISVILVILCAVMMFGYETALKQRGFIGNITIALLTGCVFLFAGAIVDNFSQVWILALLAGLVTVGREIAKDIEDEESDKGSRLTLPMVIGDRKAAHIAMAFFILGPLMSIIPIINGMFGILYATVLVADAIFIYCALQVYKDPHKAEKMAKIAMFISLISFILGVAI